MTLIKQKIFFNPKQYFLPIFFSLKCYTIKQRIFFFEQNYMSINVNLYCTVKQNMSLFLHFSVLSAIGDTQLFEERRSSRKKNYRLITVIFQLKFLLSLNKKKKKYVLLRFNTYVHHSTLKFVDFFFVFNLFYEKKRNVIAGLSQKITCGNIKSM